MPAIHIIHNHTKNRYSNTLQKDDVSACLRSIFKKLGQVLEQSRPVSVAFSFGKLQSKDRKIAFYFDPDLQCTKLPVLQVGGCGVGGAPTPSVGLCDRKLPLAL